MATIEHNDKSYEVDKDGFLLNGADEWDENWVDYVKGVEGISEITNEHQKVIDALRKYHRRNGISPKIRRFSWVTKYTLGRLKELFPSEFANEACRKACKMAGVPKPTPC